VAPAVGTILAELVTEGRCTSYDIGLFRYTRFEEGESSPAATATASSVRDFL
jgi:hypothetical protein